MNYGGILGRAVDITRRNRALWVYGFLLALFGGSYGSSGGQDFRFLLNRQGSGIQSGPYLSPLGPMQGWLMVLLVSLVLFVALWIIVGTVARFVSMSAVIGMVQDLEQEKEATVRSGWRWGWSVRTWRLFLITLLIGIPLLLLMVLLIALAFSPLILLFTRHAALQVGSIILTVILFLVALLFFLVISVLVNIVAEIIYRECVLGNHGVQESFRRGIAQVREHPGPVLFMGLILVGAGWLWGLLMIPVALILIGGAALPAIILYAVAGIGPALIVGIPLVFLAVMILSAVSGLYLVFHSASWTLTYLELAGNRTGDMSLLNGTVTAPSHQGA